MNKPKKLTLNKKVIRELSNDELGAIVGGMSGNVRCTASGCSTSACSSLVGMGCDSSVCG
jgi:natural product precursor